MTRFLPTLLPTFLLTVILTTVGTTLPGYAGDNPNSCASTTADMVNAWLKPDTINESLYAWTNQSIDVYAAAEFNRKRIEHLLGFSDELYTLCREYTQSFDDEGDSARRLERFYREYKARFREAWQTDFTITETYADRQAGYCSSRSASSQGYMYSGFNREYGLIACCSGANLGMYRYEIRKIEPAFKRALQWRAFCTLEEPGDITYPTKLGAPDLKKIRAKLAEIREAKVVEDNEVITIEVKVPKLPKPMEQPKPSPSAAAPEQGKPKEQDKPKEQLTPPNLTPPASGTTKTEGEPKKPGAEQKPELNNNRVAPVFGGGNNGGGVGCESNSNKDCQKTNPSTSPTPPEWKKPIYSGTADVDPASDMNVIVASCNPADGEACAGAGGGLSFNTKHATQCTTADNRSFDKIDRRFLACAFSQTAFSDVTGSSIDAKDTNVGENFSVWMNLAQADVFRYLFPDGLQADVRAGMCEQTRPQGATAAERASDIQRITREITLRCTEHLGVGPK